VWLHLRKEKFPTQRKFKLHSRGNVTFQVTRKINNNTYELDLPPSYKMSQTCNMGDLSPFDVGFKNLWPESLQEGGHDESIIHHEAMEDLPRRFTISIIRREASNPSSFSLFSITLCDIPKFTFVNLTLVNLTVDMLTFWLICFVGYIYAK